MIPAFANLLYVIAAWAALFLLPGTVIASRVTRRFADTSRSVALALAFAIATILVPALLFTAAAAVRLPITPWIAAAVAAIVLAALPGHVRPALALWRDVARALARPRAIAPAHLALLGFAAFAFAFQSAFFDTVLRFHFDCIYRPVALAAGWLPPDPAGGANPSLWYRDHQRLGVSQVLAPSMALFGFTGLRLLWGALFAVLPLSVYIVARRAGIPRAGALAGAAAATFLPSVIGWADQDRVMLSTSALVALALALRTPAPAIVGAAAGLLYAEDAIALVGLGAVPLAIGLHADPRWRRPAALVALAAGFAAALAPAVARYWIAFDRLFFHEHFSYIPALDYSLLGVPFQVHAFLNWPLHDHLVRSPYNAFPNLATLPLTMLQHLSLPLAAIALVGIVALARARSLRLLAPMAAWFLPIAGLLALNENWIERDKDDIVTIAYVPVFLAIAAGVSALSSARLRRPAWVGALIALSGLVAAHRALLSFDAPEDERLREVFARTTERMAPEDAEYLAFERDWHSRPPWLPWEHRFRLSQPPGTWAAQARALYDELRDLDTARERQRRRKAPPPRSVGERVLRIDLADSPSRGIVAAKGGAVRREGCRDGAPATSLTPTSGTVRVPVAWNDRPVEVELGLHPRLPYAHIAIRRAAVFDREAKDAPLAPGTCLELRVPDGVALGLSDQITMLPDRTYGFVLRPLDDGSGAIELDALDR